MTDAISYLIDLGANQLSLAGVENPRNEAELLLTEALSIERQDLWLNKECILDKESSPSTDLPIKITS